ncbi:NAD(P)-dependent alcohol dehydrogenase [bacterium RCC_150]
MKTVAATLSQLGKDFEIEDVVLDDPRAGEALVEVFASGICHTDAVAQHGGLPFPVPGVLGHEGVGRVLAVGEGVTSCKPGDNVLMTWPSCGSCRNCKAGNPRFCLDLIPMILAGGRADGSTAIKRTDGSALGSHFFGQSSFARHSIVYASGLVPFSTDIPVEAVSALSCGIATGAGAIMNAAHVEPGSSIVIYGAGAVGLSAVMAAALSPATKIVVVEPNQSRRAKALSYGATDVIDPKTDADVVGLVREVCHGPADLALDCSGHTAVVRQTIDSVGMLGTAMLIGAAPAGATFTADHQSTLWGKRIVGTLGGESQSTRFIPALLELQGQGRFPFDELIEYFDFEDINAAQAASASGDVVKPVLRMS